MEQEQSITKSSTELTFLLQLRPDGQMSGHLVEMTK